MFCLFSFALSSCSTYQPRNSGGYQYYQPAPVNYSARLPANIKCAEKTIVVDPHSHVWGAYEEGELIKAGLATAGANWCPDIKRPCRTSVGSFRIHSLGGPGCKSSKYPLPHGGGPMPYCMFFNGGQSLHGSHEVVEGNLSHGCVRLEMADVEWIRFNFANVGTKVVVKPY
jgi:lipoprotein-anchoring transpeptidase ErfK/SrfK